jgi:membrane protein DedA with SNARE-associated domain
VARTKGWHGGQEKERMRRTVGLVVAVVGVFAVAVLVGALAGYFVGRMGGSQEGEQAARVRLVACRLRRP